MSDIENDDAPSQDASPEPGEVKPAPKPRRARRAPAGPSETDGGADAAAPEQDLGSPDGTTAGASDSQAARNGAVEATADTAKLPVEDVPIAVEDARAARAALAAEVEEIEVEIRNRAGGSSGPGDIAVGLLRLIRENIESGVNQSIEPIARQVRENLSSDYLDPDFWRGIGMVLQYQIDEARGFIQRRMRGEYSTDAYGMDQEIVDIVRPFTTFLYRTWWRVTAEGLDNVPGDGRVMLIANHAGSVVPWDGAMIATALLEEHPSSRMVRVLHQSWVSTTPVLAPTLATLGQVPARQDNALRLLEDDQVVCAFPEGVQGPVKPIWQRYRLASFGKGEFVGAALRTGAPIVPVAVIGAEETYPLVGNFGGLARLLGLPYLPITPFFPWLGPIGAIPLPSKWTIVFHEPVETSAYGPEAADDAALVQQLSEQIRDTIQITLNQKVRERKSVFTG